MIPSGLEIKLNKFQCTYLNQTQAIATDVELMGELGFSIDVLMEHAGQAIAHSIHHTNQKYHLDKLQKFIFLCGPGNNGGDGITAARQLSMIRENYNIDVVIFQQPTQDLYSNLIQTCLANEINVKYWQEFEFSKETDESKIQAGVFKLLNEYDMIIDGIFGFSFQPPIRKPYDFVLNSFQTVQKPIFAIDIPSGWDVQKGNILNFREPDYLISLTLPKLVAENFTKKHYLGGRFVPQTMKKKYKWEIPQYNDNETFIQLN